MSLKKFLTITNDLHNFKKVTDEIKYLDDVDQRKDVKDFLDVIKYEIILDVKMFENLIYCFESTINYYIRHPELYIFMEFFHNLNDLRPYHKMRLPWELILSNSNQDLFNFLEIKNDNNEWIRKYYYGIEYKINATSEEQYVSLYDFIEKIFYFNNSKKINIVPKTNLLKTHIITKTFSVESNKLVGTHGILLTDNKFDSDLANTIVNDLNIKINNFDFKRSAENYSRSIPLKSNDTLSLFKFFKIDDCVILKIYPEIFKTIESKQHKLFNDIIDYSIKMTSFRIKTFCEDLKNETEINYKKKIKYTPNDEKKIIYEIDNEWDGIVRTLCYYNNKMFGQNIFFTNDLKFDKCLSDLELFKKFLYEKLNLFFNNLAINQ